MKKKALKKRDLFGTIKSTASSASSSDQVIAHSPSIFLDETNLWDSTFNAMEDAICIIDNDQRIIRCNRAMQKFSENENESIIGKHCYEIVHGTEQPVPDCPVRKMQLTHQRVCAEVKEREQWFDVTVDPLFGPEKQICGAVHILRNITDRKQTEGLIHDSEERFRGLLQNVSSVSVQGYAPDGTTQYWNKASELLYGYTEQEAIGRNLLDLIIPPEMTEDVKQAIQQMAETGEAIPSSELSLMRRDGSRVAVYSSHAIVQVPGKMPELFCIDIDISDRKRAEAALRESEEIFSQFLTKSPIYVFFKDENICSLRLSRNYEKMLGRPLDEMLGKSMDELFPSDFAKSMVETDLQIVKNGEEVTCEEEFNGRYYSTIKFPIQLEGKPTFLAGFTIDITEQKFAEEALKEREASLHELNATKDKFFSIIAHDLKSPFNSIIGFSSLLSQQLEEKDFASIEKYADIIQNSSQQAMDLLMNLLEWSRSQTGRIVFAPENIDLADLINQSMKLFSSSAQQKSITISSEVTDTRAVWADKDMINTILRNLISNAIKFTKAGGEISVSAEQMSNEVVVSVSDNGVGMGKESIAKLFSIDQNYTTLGTENEKGTGLGLLLCKEFIDKHAGRIWVESEPEKGSRFFFSIPKGNEANESLQY